MNIGSISEDKKIEKRISIMPEIIKKYIDLGFKVNLPKGYGLHLGLNDEKFLDEGAQIIADDLDVIKNSDILIQLGLLTDSQLEQIRKNQTLIGVLNPYQNQNKLEVLSKKKINIFSLELLPRITRAQSMDILSSQANLAGYKAVLESFANFEKAIPMMMTAAGIVPAAVIIIGTAFSNAENASTTAL